MRHEAKKRYREYKEAKADKAEVGSSYALVQKGKGGKGKAKDDSSEA